MIMRFLQEQRDKLQSEVSKIKNANFMEAVVAGCAAVAAADGIISPDEKQKMMGFISRSEELKNFDTQKVIDTFQKYAGHFDFDAGIGKGEAFKAVAKMKGKSEEARLLVRVCIAIAGSDGKIDDHEKQVIREICNELGLSPGDFDL